MPLTHQQFDQFVHALTHHDWYYDYSDDGRVWLRGSDAEKALKNTAATHPVLQEALTIFRRKYFPQYSETVALECDALIDKLREQIVNTNTGELTSKAA